MKVGSDPDRDPARVRTVRSAIGTAALFVDANGAYALKRALAVAEQFAEHDVRWFEEPVSSDDLAGLRLMRERAPAIMEIAAGEYPYTPRRRTADARSARRGCAAGGRHTVRRDHGLHGGRSAVCGASPRCLRALRPGDPPPLACAVPRLRHLEWFHDHVRIEHMLFDGAPVPRGGAIRPDPARPGLGMRSKRQDAEQYATT